MSHICVRGIGVRLGERKGGKRYVFRSDGDVMTLSPDASSNFQVCVCVVSDGRLKIHARTLSVLAAMGCYQEGVAKNVVNSKEVTAHIYEYTTQGECALRIVGAA